MVITRFSQINSLTLIVHHHQRIPCITLIIIIPILVFIWPNPYSPSLSHILYSCLKNFMVPPHEFLLSKLHNCPILKRYSSYVSFCVSIPFCRCRPILIGKYTSFCLSLKYIINYRCHICFLKSLAVNYGKALISGLFYILIFPNSVLVDITESVWCTAYANTKANVS